MPLALLPLFFAIFIGVLFFCCFYLFGTLCGCCSWGIHSNSPPPDCFVCAADLLRVHSAAHCLLLGLFSCPHHDELPTPPSALVSSLHAIGSLPAAVICIVCFFFFFFPVLLVYFLVFLFFPCCCFFFFFFPFISMYVFIPISACNKALSSLFDLPGSALVQTLGCGCERFLAFGLRR
jgi:hypothetical protein